ncbi:unnamed protein product [marine sediment metagenome]|uniref:Uncharacterized protein n=1 Tax=marine sediment metagenome TaxID=412755 RepID=X1Q2P5_9ZZZZ
MLVVATYKENAGEFANLTFATTFGSLYKRLRLYFSTTNIGIIKAKILGGEKITIPYMVLQKDRRRENIKVTDERRKPVKAII